MKKIIVGIVFIVFALSACVLRVSDGELSNLKKQENLEKWTKMYSKGELTADQYNALIDSSFSVKPSKWEKPPQ